MRTRWRGGPDLQGTWGPLPSRGELPATGVVSARKVERCQAVHPILGLTVSDLISIFEMTASVHFNKFHYYKTFCCCCLVANHVQHFCDPMDCSLPGSSVQETPQTRILEWVAIPFSRGFFSNPGIEHESPLLAGGSFYWSTWEAPIEHFRFFFFKGFLIIV